MDQEPMITTGLKTCTWQLRQRQTQQFGLSGNGQVITRGRPFWVLQFEYENLKPADYQALSAWISRRNGGEFTFLAYRPDRPQPLSGPANSPSFSISGSNLVIDTNAGAINPGDMAAYITSNSRRYVGEVVNVASVSGDQYTCEMRPAPPSVVSGADLMQAQGEFILEPDTLSISEPYDLRKRVGFAARQVY